MKTRRVRCPLSDVYQYRHHDVVAYGLYQNEVVSLSSMFFYLRLLTTSGGSRLGLRETSTQAGRRATADTMRTASGFEFNRHFAHFWLLTSTIRGHAFNGQYNCQA